MPTQPLSLHLRYGYWGCPACEPLADTACACAASSTTAPPACAQSPPWRPRGAFCRPGVYTLRPLRISLHRAGRGLHQEKPKTAPVGDGSQPTPLPAGLLAGNQAHLSCPMPPARKPPDLAQRKHRGQAHHRAHSPDASSATALPATAPPPLYRLIQCLDPLLQIRQQVQQIVSPPRRPAIQFQSAQQLLPCLGPQLSLLLHPLVQRNVLQLVLHPRAHLHQRVPMLQQLPQIPLLHAGHPDAGKIIFPQQLQQVARVPHIGLLLARRLRPNHPRIPRSHSSCPSFCSSRSDQNMFPLLSTPTCTGPLKDS